jgi:5-methylcytosine-specific restriction endonuclease McrA
MGYISKKDREIVKKKFNGLCAYSGTPLEDDWQVDHVKPLIRNRWVGGCLNPDDHKLENLFPTQKIINHYKGSLDLETFRSWYLGGLDTRLKKLPKKTRVESTKRRKKYLHKVAEYFDISEDKPFSGAFYFETLQDS